MALQEFSSNFTASRAPGTHTPSSSVCLCVCMSYRVVNGFQHLEQNEGENTFQELADSCILMRNIMQSAVGVIWMSNFIAIIG